MLYKKTDPDYNRMIIQQNTSRSKDFIVWGGVSTQSKTTLRFVAPGTKFNSNYYINKVLKPFLTRDVPHSAPSHTSEETIQYLNENKINYIKPEERMPASPDAAPMNYAIWGHLKQ